MSESNNNEYKSDSKYRGQAVIIVNGTFKGDQSQDRYGAEKDMSNMVNLFRALDFKVTAYKDLTGRQMKEKIRTACEDTNNEKSDCFALVISTHGHELLEKKKERHEHYRFDGAQTWQLYLLGSDKDQVRVEDLVDDLARSKTLRDKPKMLFIQACRTKSIHNSFKLEEDDDRLDAGVPIPIVLDKPKSGSQPSDAEEYVGMSLEHIVKTVIQDGAEDISKDWNKDSDPDPDEYQPDLNNDTNVQDENYFGEKMDALKEQTLLSTLENIEGTITEIRHLDMVDARGQAPDTMPNLPIIEKEQPQIFDVAGLTNFPDDFLIVYPSMFGKFAFRKKDIGSRLLYLMQKNMKYLLEGKDVLLFLTSVARELSAVDIGIEAEDKSFKVNPCIQHRLTGKVVFRPKSENSVMVNVKRKLGLEKVIYERKNHINAAFNTTV